jgi:EmrB/QacA subfamily drug resistance transporter
MHTPRSLKVRLPTHGPKPHAAATDHADRPRASSKDAGMALLLLLALAQLMVILDISAVNVALPDLAGDLGISGGDLGWTVTSYSLVFGSLLLLGGRAADLLGRRRVFLTGLGVFTFASLVSALATSEAVFFAARAGQGLGAAMLSPAALSIITTTFQGADRAKALGVWGAVGGAGAAIGVLLGGTLTEVVDWRAIFVINLPVGIGVAAAALHAVPADVARPQWRGLDLRGAVIATMSLGALVYALSQATDAGWSSAQTLGLGLAGLAGLAAFAALELHTRKPLLNVSRLGDRGVGGGFVMMLAASAVLFGSFLLTSMYLQEVLGTGALETGAAFLPMAIIIGLGSHLGGHLVGHAGLRIAMAAAFAVTAAGMLLLAGVDSHGSYASDVLPGMLVAGLGLGIALVSVALSVLTGAADHEAGMLSGLNTTGHEVGGSLGIAVVVTIATGAMGTGASTARLADGLGDAFLVSSIIAAVAGVIALFVLPSAASFLPKLRLAPRVAIH